jgi:hypothetical protein
VGAAGSLGLQSTWLLASLLALLIPLLIHLFSKSRGRLVHFAHVAFITHRRQQPVNRLRLIERLLLALRLMMLLVASLLLAGLFWIDPAPAEQQQTLVSEDWLNTVSADARANLAADADLLPVQLLSHPQRSLSAEDILNWTAEVSRPTLNLWQRIQAAASVLGPTTELRVYTTDLADQFDGGKVPIANPVDWHISTAGVIATAPVVMNVGIIASERRPEDELYLRAALDALMGSPALALSLRPMTYAQLTDELLKKTNNMDDVNVVVHLGHHADTAPFLQYVERGHVLLLDSAPMPARAPVDTVVLSRDDGTPLLTRQRQGRGQILRLHGRFLPEDNSLVASPDFPLRLAGLLAGDSIEAVGRLSAAQITRLPAGDARNDWYSRDNLRPWLVLLLVCLFCAERVLSEWPTGASPMGSKRSAEAQHAR